MRGNCAHPGKGQQAGGGTYEKSRNFGFVVPDDPILDDIFVAREDAMGAGKGTVVVETGWPEKGETPREGLSRYWATGAI